jgi:hypothetical protein
MLPTLADHAPLSQQCPVAGVRVAAASQEIGVAQSRVEAMY